MHSGAEPILAPRVVETCPRIGGKPMKNVVLWLLGVPISLLIVLNLAGFL